MLGTKSACASPSPFDFGASKIGPSTQVRFQSQLPSGWRTLATQLKQMPMPQAIGVSSDTKQRVSFALAELGDGLHHRLRAAADDESVFAARFVEHVGAGGRSRGRDGRRCRRRC